MKAYTVFNVEQIEGLPPHFYAIAAPQIDLVQRIETADRFFANTGADILHGGNQADYANEPDHVQMPPFVSFKDGESYRSTLAHEMAHNAETRIMPTRLPCPRLGGRRGLRQGRFTGEPRVLAGQSGPADDRRDGSGGLVKPRL